MKIITTLMIVFLTLTADEITLTKEQKDNWQIKTQMVLESDTISLGNFMVEVVTPPTLLSAITLAFKAQVTKLYVASYQSIKEGDLLAKVSGAEWIDAQKEAISSAISLKESRLIANRKNRLCKEGVIAQKECIAINAVVQNAKAKLSASKAVLHAYGADKEVITEVVNSLKIKQNLPIKAKVSGVIIKLNAQVGKSIDTSSPMMLIQKDGTKWLESDIPLGIIESLKEKKSVIVNINNNSYTCKVLQFSPIINTQNQTIHVRFALAKEADLLSGYRATAQIIIDKSSLIVDKKAVIKSKNRYVVFVETPTGYKSIEVKVLAEDKSVYYIALNSALNAPIAISSLVTLKSLIGD